MSSEFDTRRYWRRRRVLAGELYRPASVHLVILGEAPPPERFFYFGDSLFFRYLARAFAPFVGEEIAGDAGRFLALYRAIGGWRIDVCEEPVRASKGGADDVSECLESFRARWDALPLVPDAVLIVSPKRLYAALPHPLQAAVTTTLPPPGQWNAHRRAFLDGMERVLTRDVGVDVLRDAASQGDADDAALDFKIARACADGVDEGEVTRLLAGHPREGELMAVWEASAEA